MASEYNVLFILDHERLSHENRLRVNAQGTLCIPIYDQTQALGPDYWITILVKNLSSGEWDPLWDRRLATEPPTGIYRKAELSPPTFHTPKLLRTYRKQLLLSDQMTMNHTRISNNSKQHESTNKDGLEVATTYHPYHCSFVLIVYNHNPTGHYFVGHHRITAEQPTCTGEQIRTRP